MEFISFRADKKLQELARKLAALESRKTSDEYRDVFMVGLREKMKIIATEKYKRGEVSLSKAAELAGVSVWEFLDLLKEKKIPLNIDFEDVLEAVEEI